MSPIRFDEGDGSQILTEHLTDKPHPAYLIFGIGRTTGLKANRLNALGSFSCCAAVSPGKTNVSSVHLDVSGIRHQVNMSRLNRLAQCCASTVVDQELV
jgi:hypothetical protein